MYKRSLLRRPVLVVRVGREADLDEAEDPDGEDDGADAAEDHGEGEGGREGVFFPCKESVCSNIQNKLCVQDWGGGGGDEG